MSHRPSSVRVFPRAGAKARKDSAAYASLSSRFTASNSAGFRPDPKEPQGFPKAIETPRFRPAPEPSDQGSFRGAIPARPLAEAAACRKALYMSLPILLSTVCKKIFGATADPTHSHDNATLKERFPILGPRSARGHGNAPAAAGENVVPPLLDAARAYATLFEIRHAMEEVFGAYREPVFF